MDLSCRRLLFLVVLAFTLSSKGYSQPLVPTIITFGDFAVDVGNNNYIPTLFKANYPPYGKDFVNHQPTGRFCNGKLVTNFTTDTLQFTNYAPPYLSPRVQGKNLLIGANFASWSGDFLQNYYVNPILNKAYTPQQYISILVSTFSSFIKVPSQLKML
ncbi:hypothetical protein Patl1_04426 [Pistacia atlantica]|uniref:Uncharacterized protein n=1 Tax=Pistacia atlantica TaxID=434234 RepID=A0ACC1BQY4_9ROSI|nr:hypothetical protein Patl1_04426 [Pistacia atlantica]